MKRIILICPHCGSNDLKKWGMGHSSIKCNSCDKNVKQENADMKEITGRLEFVEVLNK